MIAPDRTKAPAIKTFGRLHLPPQTVETLPGGVTLNVSADDGCPLTRLCIVGSGGKDEASSPALAMVAAALATEGSRSCDEDATADILDFCGATISGRCTDHFTRVEITSLAPAMLQLLPVVGALIAEPQFSRGRLEAVKSSLASRCAYEASRVDDIAYKAAFRMIAGEGNPQLRFPMPEDFASPESPQVYKRLNEVFRAERVHVFISGAVDAALLDAVRSIVATFPAGVALKSNIVPYSPAAPAEIHIPHSGAEQCAVEVMIPAISRSHPDYIPLRLAVTALGGFFGSRLMQNIREDKGLTYGISASLNGVQEGSFVDISAQCAPEYTRQLIDELRIELAAMRTRLLSKDELLRMRLFEQTRLASLLDNAIATGDHYLTAHTIGLPPHYFEEQEKITAEITPEEIAEVSARYLRPEEMRTVIVGEK